MSFRVPRVISVLILVPQLALAAASMLATHQGQAITCRGAFARARSSAADAHARSDAAMREEVCLVEADDGVLPVLSRSAGETTDVPNIVQTCRDASAAFCGVLAEKSVDLEGPALARMQCVADRESELARLIDEYAMGGQPPSSVLSGVPSCDDAFKASRSSGEGSAWANLASCTVNHVKGKAGAFVPKFADGDPLGTLAHTPEQVATTFGSAVTAVDSFCDVLASSQAAQREPMRLRCRAESAANVAKAVADRLR
jgi:hypothetical protein